MKHFLSLLIIALLLAGCRSQKQAAVVTPQQEEATWQNVQMPVTMSVLKPQKLSVSGTATLVRGEYVYISLRFLGFEVGQVNITPEEADMVLKQPQKLWVNVPVAQRLADLGIPFTSLQEILMGNRDFMSKVPAGLNVEFGGTEQKPEVRVTGKVRGKDLEVQLTWNLANAKWDQPEPKAFTAPGSGYKKLTAEEALKLLNVK